MLTSQYNNVLQLVEETVKETDENEDRFAQRKMQILIHNTKALLIELESDKKKMKILLLLNLMNTLILLLDSNIPLILILRSRNSTQKMN